LEGDDPGCEDATTLALAGFGRVALLALLHQFEHLHAGVVIVNDLALGRLMFQGIEHRP